MCESEGSSLHAKRSVEIRSERAALSTAPRKFVIGFIVDPGIAFFAAM
jgi:hypothetical protein